MSDFFVRVVLQRCCIALIAALATAVPALAAPGAHGPGGEHLDAPAGTATTGALPRVEAKSETFELVGTLYASELSIQVDRYETNEPVFNGKLEIESAGVKAVAQFHADHGDYAVDDEKLLAVLRRPGDHALVFTLIAGKESDLLDGTLVTAAGAAQGADHQHDGALHNHGQLRIAAFIALVAAAMLALWWWLRRRTARSSVRA